MFKPFKLIFMFIVLQKTNCDDANFDSSLLTDEKPKDLGAYYVRQSLKLYPGTEWCGETVPGEKTHLDLETDKCCLEHAYCVPAIDANSTNFGLTNDNPFSVSECSCDKEMLACMNAVDTKISRDVQYIFFGIQHPPCFNFIDPEKTKAEYSGPIRDPQLAKEMDEGSYSFTPPSTWDAKQDNE